MKVSCGRKAAKKEDGGGVAEQHELLLFSARGSVT
jgi:hypothetical protein